MPVGVLFPALVVANMGVEQSAAWFICLAICSIFSLLDFGISSLLMKKISTMPQLMNHKYFLKLLILYSIIIVTFFIMLPFNFKYHILTWYSLNTEPEIIFAFSCFLGFSALIAIQRVLESCVIALKFGYIISNLEIVVALLRLLSLFVMISVNLKITLFSLVIVYTFPSILSFLIALYYFMKMRRKTEAIPNSTKLIQIHDVGFSLKSWLISLSAYGNRSGFFLIASIFFSNEEQVILGIVMLILTTAMQVISTALAVIPPYVSVIIAEFNINVRNKFMRFVTYNQLLVTLTLMGFLLVGIEILELLLNQTKTASYEIFVVACPMLISYGFFSTSNVARTVLMFSDESSYVCKTEALFVFGYLSVLGLALISVGAHLWLISLITSCYFIIRYYLGVWKKFKTKYLFALRPDIIKFSLFCFLSVGTYISVDYQWSVIFIKSTVLLVGISYISREVSKLKHGNIS